MERERREGGRRRDVLGDSKLLRESKYSIGGQNEKSVPEEANLLEMLTRGDEGKDVESMRRKDKRKKIEDDIRIGSLLGA